MKRILVLFALISLAVAGIAQTPPPPVPPIPPVEVIEADGVTIIRMGDKEFIRIDESGGDVNISVDGNSLLKVQESDKGVNLLVNDSIIIQTDDNQTTLDGQFVDVEEILEKVFETLEQSMETLEDSLENIEVNLNEQEDEINITSNDSSKRMLLVQEKRDGTNISIGQREWLGVEEGADTTRIRLGNKELTIAEDEEGKSSLHLDEKERKKDKKDKFNGHWAGVELGLNNYLDSDFGFSSPAGTDFDLNTNRSMNFNLNFAEFDFGLISDKFGIVTGAGLEWCNYFFDNNNAIIKDSIGMVVGQPAADGVNYTKSKLATTYLTVPLLFEVQFPGHSDRDDRVHLSAGIIGGIKLDAHTRWCTSKMAKSKS